MTNTSESKKVVKEGWESRVALLLEAYGIACVEGGKDIIVESYQAIESTISQLIVEAEEMGAKKERAAFQPLFVDLITQLQKDFPGSRDRLQKMIASLTQHHD